MSVDANTVELMNRLVSLCPRSQREIAESIGWAQPPMNGALKGQRSFPASRVLPLLEAVGVGQDKKPSPGTVWRGVCDQSNLDEAIAILRQFMPVGGTVAEISRTTRSAKAVSGRVSLSHFNELSETVLAFTYPQDGVRGVLRVVHEPELAHADGWRPPEATGIAEDIGAEYGGRVELSRAEYAKWRGKEPLSIDEFDSVVGQVVTVHAPTWDDVRAKLDELMQAGAEPARVLRALRLGA